MDYLERGISLIDPKLKELQQSVEVKEEFFYSTFMRQLQSSHPYMTQG
jgi:hypothetical protein